MSDFPASAPAANPVFYRTYSRKGANGRESWQQVIERNLSGLAKLGRLTDEQVALLRRMQLEQKALPSGRWLWVGGTEWIEKPENVSGAYNCTSTDLTDWRAFALMMDLAMMGSGTGAIIEPHMVDMLPVIRNKLNVTVVGEFGDKPSDPRTLIFSSEIPTIPMNIQVEVGDSRDGWVKAYELMFYLASPDCDYAEKDFCDEVNLTIDVSKVRPSGEPLKGFGGTANPVKLKDLFIKMAKIFNKAQGRKLTSVECCLLIDEAALVVVAGNVRRSAGIRQFSANDIEASIAKDNLWQQDEDGNWRIDPERDALRMANHTLVYHHYPTKQEIVDSVRRQFLSGEGAIMFAPEAIARANRDILPNRQLQGDFISAYCDHKQSGAEMIKELDPDCMEDSDKLEHRMGRYGINPCFAPGTMVMTRDGDYPIESLVGKTVEIHDGEKWIEIDNFRVTGVNQSIFRVCLSLGRVFVARSIQATEYHTFVLSNGERLQLKDLKPGMMLKVNKTVGGRTNGLERVKAAKILSIHHIGVAEKVYCCTVPGSHQFTLSNGVIVGNCGEIQGKNFHCNLSEVHLNRISPTDHAEQKFAFSAAALSVASLLHHKFQEPRYQYSRDLDPIVGVSFTGLFDFFVEAFGAPWLEWWAEGRPDSDTGIAYKEIEARYLSGWREIVEETIKNYCDHHGLKCPNRMTTCQPAGCLDRNALRVFDQGLLYADEIVDPGSGETNSLPLSVRGGIGATTAIANDPLDLVCLKFANGRELRMTPDHRLSVQGRWIRADQMNPGMIVDHQLGAYQRTDEALLLHIDATQYSRETRINEAGHGRGVIAKTITTPSMMSEDLAYFIGAMYGNGCMSESKHRVRFSHERIDVLHRLSMIGLSLFGIEGSIRASNRSTELPVHGAVELCFASRQLFDWLKLNRLDKHAKSFDIDRIPEAIRRSSRNSILAFFAGLIDCDGCARNHTFSIDAASEKFMRNLQQVGEAVGLCLGLSHNTKGSNFQNVKSMWSLSLSRMKSDFSAVNTLNFLSIKLKERPVQQPSRRFSFEPYKITDVITENGSPDYSFDFAIEGVDDDDAWYWQGALKSHNTKSLLTGASPGWHPPKAQRFIRRITFRKNDPVALACLEYGYTIVPSQSDKDEQGRLLDDPFDPRCTEWLVEIPTEVSWANLPGADKIRIDQFSALAQFDFYMQVQRYYTRHNTSATIEFREHEIEPLASKIHDAIVNHKGYISAALLARFDANETFPRLPFEPIDKATYERLHEEVLQRRKGDDFFALLRAYDSGSLVEAGPAGCDSDKCLLPQVKT